MKMVRLLEHIYLRQQLILISKFLFLINPEENNGEGTRSYYIMCFLKLILVNGMIMNMGELFENQFYSAYSNHTTVPGITFDMTNEILFLL